MKRNLLSETENGAGGGAAAKKSKRQHERPSNQNVYVDPKYGQKYAFTSMGQSSSLPVDEELEFEDDTDAMAYLGSVRTEANSIPQLLVAPKLGPQLPPAPAASGGLNYDDEPNDYYSPREAVQRDFRGYYEDGAYIGAPDEFEEDDDDGLDYDGEVDEEREEAARQKVLHDAYCQSLSDQFLALRQMLHQTPDESAVNSLPKTHSFHVGKFGPRSGTFLKWSTRIRTTDPLPAQVASMDKDSVMRVLRVLIGGKFLRRGCEIRERTSRWIWALLARLPDRGELNHTEIGWIRDLGRRAVLLTRSLAEMAALREEIEARGGDLGLHDAVDESDEDEEDEAYNEIDVENGIEEPEDLVDDKTEGSKPQSPGKNASVAEDTVDKECSSSRDMDLSDGEIDEREESTDPAPNATDVTEGKHAEEVDAEEGEIDDAVPSLPAAALDLDEAKNRLLEQLDNTSNASSDSGEDDSEMIRARTNMRATLNLILTVAGEFYGQRDLLEFREVSMEV